MQRMELNQNLIHTLRQEQIMAPQQIQALEILLATIPELEQKIHEEMSSNPTLELLENGTEHLVGNPVEGAEQNTEMDGDAAAAAAEKDEALATLIQLNEVWQDTVSPPRMPRGSNGSEDQERRQFMFDSLVSEPTLQELLLEQLRQAEVDEQMRQICEQIIGSIDDTGYLRTHPSDIAIAADAEASEVKKALTLVQSFDPPGVGARDLRECLLLQLERRGDKNSMVYELVEKHLDEVGRNQIPKVARALHVSSTRVYELLEDVRELSPYPGSLMTSSRTDFVYPEVFVEKDSKGEWQVRANRDYRPRLQISPYYLKLLQNPDTPREVKSYIREKVGSSKLLLRAIDQRQSTIERIAVSLLKFQYDFFEEGVSAMKPLVMSEVADDIKVHETTVSRAIANKYMQTPHGLFPFKHFFTSGYETENGEKISSLSIKQKLHDLVNAEDPRKPLSDQKLAKLLKEQGFNVARRTVAKYREEENILPSNMRRSY